MRKYLIIGVLMVAGIILVCSEASGMIVTMGVKFAGLLSLASVAYLTKGEEA